LAVLLLIWTLIVCGFPQCATRRLVCRHSANSQRPVRKVDEGRARLPMVTFSLTRRGVPSRPTVRNIGNVINVMPVVI